MSAYMVIAMDILDDSWIEPYFADVGKLLQEYGVQVVAGARDPRRMEGTGKTPDRVAVLRFKDMATVDAFWEDPRYLPWREKRLTGSRSDIYVFEDAAPEDGGLV